ncbi:hypothetical protein MVEN_01100100 [Mycena venus]|uniref:Uncharacterized protein n=1 Tax=Mycena venus TaxID=2733690 RepID=A0A8H6Y940_9AGAR|nr:hypothetical protein MVEN_01100100 [Mycena venus]
MANPSDVLVSVGPISSSPGGPIRFIPFAAKAPDGTTVRFQWIAGTGSNFSIAQSSASDPCKPIPGGFDSGFRVGTAGSTDSPEWSFTVEDDRTPVFFFAQQGVQVSSCLDAFFVVNPSQNETTSSSSSPSSSQSQNTVTNSYSFASRSSPSSTTTIMIPSPSVSPDRTHSNTPVLVGAIVGSLVILLVCVTAIFIRRRRILQRHTTSQSLGSHTEGGLPAFVDESRLDMRPEPFILDEKATESSLPIPNTVVGVTLPTAAELVLASMANEMRVLRGQVQLLERERRGIGDGDAPPNELPPAYAPGI